MQYALVAFLTWFLSRSVPRFQCPAQYCVLSPFTCLMPPIPDFEVNIPQPSQAATASHMALALDAARLDDLLIKKGYAFSAFECSVYSPTERPTRSWLGSYETWEECAAVCRKENRHTCRHFQPVPSVKDYGTDLSDAMTVLEAFRASYPAQYPEFIAAVFKDGNPFLLPAPDAARKITQTALGLLDLRAQRVSPPVVRAARL